MASVKLYNVQGEEIGNIELESSLFEVAPSVELVHEAVVAQTANSRSVIAHTKDRSEVNGSGKKPWKQKGTGRARHGSRYSPIWRGGGITFGPQNIRSFVKKINKKAKRKALAMVLSDKVSNEKLIVVDSLKIENGKTKILAEILGKLPVSQKKMLIIAEKENIDVARAAKNLQKVKTLPAHCLNVVDLLANDYVLITKPAVDMVVEMYKR